MDERSSHRFAFDLNGEPSRNYSILGTSILGTSPSGWIEISQVTTDSDGHARFIQPIQVGRDVQFYFARTP